MNKNIMFITGCYDKKKKDYFEKNTIVMLQNAADTLSWRIIEGLEGTIPRQFIVVTAPFVGYYPNQFKQISIPSCDWSHNDSTKDKQIGFLNIKGIETIEKSRKIANTIADWYRESKNNRFVLLYSHYAGFMRAIRIAKKKCPELIAVCLITDMPEVLVEKDTSLIMRFRHIFRDLMFSATKKGYESISGFAFLTERMSGYVDGKNKPYVVIEGIAEGRMYEDNKIIRDKGITRVVYTGTLHKKYGILTLIKAFKLLPSNIELHICGSGDSDNDVKNFATSMSNVFYHGTLKHEEALSLQESAHILVNPRPNEGMYTSLSFPSKIMEYMKAGKPVLCFKLDGIPNEYDDYLIYFMENTTKAIANTILNVTKMTDDELTNIGLRNKRFVLDNKNPTAQVNKILMLFERIQKGT